MKLKTGILVSFLVIGLLLAPNCIFAQQCEDSSSDAVIQGSLESSIVLNSLTPLVKGSSGGSRGGSSSSSKSSSKKIHDGDDDDTTSSDDGSGWWITIIILVIIFGIIGVLVWYFVLRK